MSAGTLSRPSLTDAAVSAPSVGLLGIGWQLLKLAGSLKITVSMFFLGTLILFVGTLAQDEETIVDVKKAYFNSWIATVPLDVFVPQTIWPHEKQIPFAFAIPGGALVGLVLLINLVAAKLTRFSMIAKGQRFAVGLSLTLIGFGLIAIIVLGAHMGDGLQGEPPFPYAWIWSGLRLSLFLSAILAFLWSVLWTPRTTVVRWTAWSITLLTVGLSAFLIYTQLFMNDAFRIPDPGLRIVWQLTKSLVVSAVLLTGLIMLFGQRGGNVLIHLGVGLLMVGQFLFGDAQREERLTIFEGQKSQMSYEQESVELAFIDESDSKQNHIVAFDHPMLQSAVASKKYLSTAQLPFEFRVEEYWENTKDASADTEPDPRIEGLGKGMRLAEAPKAGGAKSSVNFATAIIEVRSKQSQRPIGRYMVSQFINDDVAMHRADLERLECDGKPWRFGLRFRRNYKPYSVVLDDVVLEQYTGTMKPKDYSSYVKILGPDGSTLQSGRIWMNNPMRFRGETFYQSGYLSAADSQLGVEQTTLQVVTNAGWLIPYVACVLTGLGMLVHFSGTLARFASRYERTWLKSNSAVGATNSDSARLPKNKSAGAIHKSAAPAEKSTGLWPRILLPVLVCLPFGYLIVKNMRVPTVDRDTIDWYAIGQLPVQYGGRIKPLSSASAEFMEILSNKKYALSKDGHVYEPVHKTGKPIDSVQWFMSAITQEDWVLDSPLIRIDAAETTSTLGLKRHQSHRYSYNEIAKGLSGVREQLDFLFRTRRENWSFEQQKLAEVIEKVFSLENLIRAYDPIVPRVNPESNPQSIKQEIELLQEEVDRVRSKNPIAMIPPISLTEGDGASKAPRRWEPFGTALFETVKLRSESKESKKESVIAFMELKEAFSKSRKDPQEINKLVSTFKSKTQEEFGAETRTDKVTFEAWYEHFDPILLATRAYVFCGLLALLGLVTGYRPLRSATFWLLVMILLVHTFAIGSRMYISGKPPVATLYAAAVFIGWAIVLFGSVAEVLFPISIAALIASVLGYLSLLVAHGLDLGDSMPELEAVLDTQFWLATHVTSVSLGYSATFLAGFLGIAIVVATFLTRMLGGKSPLSLRVNEHITTLYKICYGIVCFGIFFSFVGTVLGGLWGDDSWGRFWGWDPKENGAMMIVLWNALLLHARWDKMVSSLGFGILAIVGNMITAWSMFGTNLLGVGLHSYGFSKETYNYLVTFVISQAVLVLFGILVANMKKPDFQSEIEAT